jgi:hypothetical protein
MIDDIPPMPDLAGRAGTFASTGTGVLAAGASTLVGTAAGVVVGSGALAAGASPPPAKPRRQRKPSIGRMIAAAERRGKSVTSITTPDGVTLHFSKLDAAEGPSNPWLDDLKVPKQ